MNWWSETRKTNVLKKDFEKTFHVLELRIDHIKDDLANIKSQRSTLDAIHVLRNFIRLVQYNVKMELLVRRANLESIDITWESVKKPVRSKSIVIDIVERFGIECDDWFTLSGASSQINELKHRLTVSSCQTYSSMFTRPQSNNPMIIRVNTIQLLISIN